MSSSDAVSPPLAVRQSTELRKKDGSLSKLRSHGGNTPVLPQTKLCPYCPAKFTRTTHLNRHLKTHTNERLHRCDTCEAQFTRSDLLTRHKKTCNTRDSHPRRKSCLQCKESKTKCSGENPCSRCINRDKECVYTSTKDIATAPSQASAPSSLDSLLNLSSSEKSLPFNRSAASSDWEGTVSSDTGDVTEYEAPIDSHLSALYSSDMFEPFFTSIFSPQSSTNEPSRSEHLDDIQFPFYINIPEYRVPNELDIYGQTFSQPQLGISDFLRSSILGNVPYDSDLPSSELQHYLYLFFAAFSMQMPLIHFPTFRTEGKPEVLLNAMRACGALFDKTQKAHDFVTRVLASAREVLIHEFAKNPTDSSEVVHLILAVVLLQTIGLFHQKSDQRVSSSVYHGMLVMMIRRTGLIQKTASWSPSSFTDMPLSIQWQEWALNETTKRALLLSFLHDTCQVIYFALPASYNTAEIMLNLPCENALWEASSEGEWFRILQTSSAYGSAHDRLTGYCLTTVLKAMSTPQQLPVTLVPLTPFAHFILVHVTLSKLFTICVENRLPPSMRTSPITDTLMEQEIFGIQFSLHAWLDSWRNSPDAPRMVNEEPAFFDNALPFYWLAQVSLLAYQEGLPPFELNSANNLNVDERFRLVKHWLSKIRSFLKRSDNAPTLFWDELMKIRLKAWQIEMASPEDDQEGLLAFFSEK